MTVTKSLSQGLIDLNILCGGNWLSKASTRWRKSAWIHSIVSAYHYASEVLNRGDEAILQNEHALKILFWQRNISGALDLIDLCRFQQRIRDVKDCDKVLYEIQVATLYRNSGYDVTFQDVSQQGYEFKVSNETGAVYMECKKKGETERDRQALRAWEQLRAAIEKSMVITQRYAYIFLQTTRDPMESDVPHIESLIQNLLTENTEGDVTQGDYWVRIEHIRPPDFTERASFLGILYPSTASHGNPISVTTKPSARLPSGPHWPKKPQYAVFQCEANPVGGSLAEARKIMAIGFKSLEERDYITTVINSFDEVRRRKQLPSSGPGIIYIEIGQPSGGVTVEQRFDEIEKAIRLKMRGKWNRRVNAVVLTCTGKMPVNAIYDGKKKTLPGIVTLARIIPHDNPRSPLPDGFNLLPTSLFTWVPRT